ncbi:MAG TPA: phospholipase [Solirubrobacteraceae bacterium]|nr:phospholipase [Solirubrobacteraceae bacterium]
MSELIFRERPARGAAKGLLVLHHGRGADEHELIGLADLFDPKQRLHVVAPRGPYPLPETSGYRWYKPTAPGLPEPESFKAAYSQLATLHDELWERTELTPAQTVLGGHSQGASMGYALGLGAGRPAPAGVLAMSGFIPIIDGWQPSTLDRTNTRVLISHGTDDPILAVDHARRARDELRAAGLTVEYHESRSAHRVDPRTLPSIAEWIAATLDR